MTSYSDTLQSYQDYLILERRLSTATAKAYGIDVAQWMTFLEWEIGITQAEEANRSHVRSWLAQLVDRGIDHRSVNRKLSTLRSFYKFILATTPLEQNPAVGIPALKEKKRLVRALTQEEVESLLDPVSFPVTEEGERDRFLLFTLYAFGLRRAELIGLTHGAVSLFEKVIRVVGKRNKERMLPMLPEWEQAYVNFLSRQTWIASSAPVFQTLDQKPLPPRVVYSLVHAYLQKASSIEIKSPHVLRHTFATHLLEMGADLSAIRSLLGHANLSATQIYTHASMEQL
ncbi:MAG: tyrosine-type recombinase/integrase, partial [Cryomorphaceae bacterium]